MGDVAAAETHQLSLEVRLRNIHQEIAEDFPAIVRMGVALYDPETDTVKAFVDSNLGNEPGPFIHYDALLEEQAGLRQLAKSGDIRIIDDLSSFSTSANPRSRDLAATYASSYTRPLFEHSNLLGFLFCDASERAYFRGRVLRRMAMYSELVAALLSSSQMTVRVLRSMLSTAAQFSHTRDPETGAHLDRVAHYARIIARGAAEDFGLSDGFIERVFGAAPMHDLGKIGIPDSILLKPERLNAEELEIMRTHVVRGGVMLERLLSTLGLPEIPEADMIRNVVLYHHESWNGQGYPHGLQGEAIPIEARIVCLADVFDALTSHRPYKPAWSFERAFTYVGENAGRLFDPRCAHAMLGAQAELSKIKEEFGDAIEIWRNAQASLQPEAR